MPVDEPRDACAPARAPEPGAVWAQQESTAGAQSATAAPAPSQPEAFTHAAQMQEMSRLLLESAGDGIYGLDPDGCVIFANRAAEEMVGWSQAEMRGATQHDLVHHSHADGSAYLRETCPIYQALRDNQSHRRENEVFWRKDGTSFPVSYNSTPVLVDGVNLGAVVIFRDITEQLQEREWEKRKTAIFASIVGQDALETTLARIAQALHDLHPAYAAAVLVREGDMLHLRGEAGLSAELRKRICDTPVVPATNRPGLVTLQKIEATQPLVFAASETSPVLREWSLPLHTGSGEVLGVLALFGQVGDRDRNLLETISVEAAELAQLALEHDRLQRQLSHQAQHDALTGLPNRMLLEDRLEQAIRAARRHDSSLGVCYLDLDRFKQINDTLGHGVGDRYLQTVTRILREGCREIDTLARQGGDEFILLLPDLADAEEGLAVAERILGRLAEPFLLGETKFSAAASVGISLYPQHGDSPMTLLQHADTALYAAKRAGRNQVKLYDATLGAQIRQYTRIQSELHEAIARDQLHLVYQPIYDFDRELQGLEALLRWRHPVDGEISPVQFIPIAEESGLIVPIGNWVLQEACRNMALWQEKGLRIPRLFVNVSAVQLNREEFGVTVLNALRSSGLHPSMLGLEITETWIVADPAAASKCLRDLRNIGVSISVDDFGTGQSSFGCLHDLPLDSLKIDRSFISRLDGTHKSLATVRAIVALAQHLGLRTVAEGVETEEQIEQLRGANCDSLQGFLLARPWPAAEVEALLQLPDSEGRLPATGAPGRWAPELWLGPIPAADVA